MKKYLPHQQRVIEEKKELDERREKLSSFFENPVFDGLEKYDQELLREQEVVMNQLSFVLEKRIERF